MQTRVASLRRAARIVEGAGRGDERRGDERGVEALWSAMSSRRTSRARARAGTAELERIGGEMMDVGIETVETLGTLGTLGTLETVETVETVDTVQTVETGERGMGVRVRGGMSDGGDGRGIVGLISDETGEEEEDDDEV